MKNKKYCETLKAGFYLYEDETLKRCFYLTGTTKGNKWIELNVPNPVWMGLLWNCISQDEVEQSTFHTTNPTNFLIK